MQQLLRLADDLGIRIVERGGPTPGGFQPVTRTIRLAPGMSRRTTRSILAHELGHAHLGHQPTREAALRARQERQADEWAAARLITPTAYAAAEQLRGPHPPSIAFELDVTIEVVLAFQRLLLRQRGPASAA
ncbi:ImmA/IrrE family metallo-endopeptidase [Microbacterium sp. BLY]|uniref:ImmA/IrrE family metallo-endopeptidase n=1 Tax=Microbacterium sp. BLY TaxID=2823280 RepID=UPI001B32D571|nr:ImmA/IrrE family metallo-endopeptidase [Microbacterium sp. BLY]MBP3978896.1 ImmA/IrrE family metallo-endopeptidase [Microbacterium sp. BLY]